MREGSNRFASAFFMHSLQSFDYSLKCNSSAYLMCMHSHVLLYTPFFTPKNVAQLYNVNIHKSLVRSCVCLFVWGCPCIITSRYITLYTQTYYAAMPFLYHQSNSTYKRVLLFSLSLSDLLSSLYTFFREYSKQRHFSVFICTCITFTLLYKVGIHTPHMLLSNVTIFHPVEYTLRCCLCDCKLCTCFFDLEWYLGKP